MKRGFKVVSFMMVLLVVASMLGGCVADFDARRYVQGTLDCYLKGEFDDYMYMTDSTEAEAQELYEYYYSFVYDSYEGYEVTDEVLEDLIEAYKALYKQTVYTANEGEKNTDGTYTVVVDITPMTAIEELNKEYNDRFTEKETEFYNEMDNGAEYTTADWDQMVAELELEMIEECLDNVPYGEPTSVSVTVYEDYDGFYVISSEDYLTLDDTIITY